MRQNLWHIVLDKGPHKEGRIPLSFWGLVCLGLRRQPALRIGEGEKDPCVGETQEPMDTPSIKGANGQSFPLWELPLL